MLHSRRQFVRAALATATLAGLFAVAQHIRRRIGQRPAGCNLANRIADRVADTLPRGPFRRSERQRMAQLATDLRSKGGRNT